MIGLEGSGFTICLGIILLLTGVVMYYCKSKISHCEQKMTSMMTLITGLHQEINQLKSQNVGVMMSGGYSHEENVDSQEIEQEYGSDSESEEEDTNDTRNETETETDIKTASSFLNHPYSELIPTTEFIEVEVNESSESEDDEESGEEPTVKVVDLGEIEELTVPVEEDATQNIEESDESDDSDELEETDPIDYSKMQVAALKKMASERQLTSNVSKMRKQELVELLQGH
ncbi:MAG: Rho termination factor N-terminal domain-containing protein [Vampirovibrionia bacterium]